MSAPVPAPERAAPPGPPDRAGRALGVVLVLVLTVLLCLWGAFLVPLRVGTVRLPVSLLVAAVGNVLLGRAGGRLLGTVGIAVPAVVWLGLAYLLGTRRTEGDLVVQGDAVGTLFLVLGALGFAVAYGMRSVQRAAPPRAAATPAASARR